MSKKGGLNSGKHGGPHSNTHGLTYFMSTDGKLIPVADNDVQIGRNVGADTEPIQDGDSNVDTRSSHAGCSFIEFIPTECGDEGEELATFEAAVVDSNAEWIRTKVTNLGSIFGDGLDLGDKVKDMCELYTSPQEEGSHVDSVITLNTDTSGLLSKHVGDVNKQTIQSLSSPSSPTQAFLSLPALGRSRSFSDGGDRSTLNPQDRACLEEIEKGSQLSPEDKELFESKQEELRALELHELQKDNSLSLMTPQELESMPEQGIEFEESVGPKPVEYDNPSVSVFTSSDSFVASSISTNTRALTRTTNSCSSQSRETKERTATSSSKPNQGNSIATISIATDKSTNLTQILINTSQGKQVLQINATDLVQSDASQGLGSDVKQVLNPSVTEAVGADHGDQDETGMEYQTADGDITGITGYLMIPAEDGGYLLQPTDGSQVGNLEEEDEASQEEILKDMGILSTQTLNGINVWACNEPDCDKVFPKASKLKIHLMTHTGERPFKCTYPKCEWAFTTGYKLKRHMESHDKRKDFVCEVDNCGRRFTTIYNLKTHMKIHERPMNEVCSECGAKFTTVRKLDLHMKTHEGAQKTYKCPHEGCDKFFFSPHCMGSHARVHQKDRDLTCKFEGCGKVFDKLCRLKSHMRQHTGEKPYVCQVEGCGWAFHTASKLKRHERKHTGERRYECPYEGCGKAFMRAEHLKGHLITHSGGKPFACPVEGCSGRFTAKSSLYVHIKKHTQSPDKAKISYFCPMDGCDKKYSNKGSLWTHITKHYQETLNTDPANEAVAEAQDGAFNASLLRALAAHINLTPDMKANLSKSELGVVPVLTDLPAGTLEALAAGQQEAQAATDVLVSPELQNGLVADGTAVINPDLADVDLTALAAAGVTTTPAIVNGTVMTRLVIPTNECGQAAQTLISTEGLMTNTLTTTALLNPVTASAASTTSMPAVLALSDLTPPAPAPDQPRITVAPDIDLSCVLQDTSSSGSARTDYQSNRMLSDRARKRRKLLRDKTGSSDLDLNDLGDPLTTSTTSAPTSTSDPTFAPADDIMTSQGIIFKDSETGITYVQTQLLQDDPPPTSGEFYCDDTSNHSGLSAELTMSMLQDPTSGDGSEPGAEFTGTTINLQDLE